jgi:hypothetical protein
MFALRTSRIESPSMRGRSRCAIRIVVLSLALGCTSSQARAADPPKLEAQAPSGQVVLKRTQGGAYFVAKDLKEKYDQLLNRLGQLKSDLTDGRLPADDVLRELKELEPRLEELRKEIEARKVLVSPVKGQKQTEELAFNLGPEQRLIVTADQIHVVGWDGPQVKCVLEKVLLLAGDQPETEEFKAIRLVHRHARASEFVGQSDEERAAAEKAFLAEKREKPLSDEQLAARRSLVENIQAGYAPFRDFQGKEVDLLTIEGLTYEQGNRQIIVGIRSDDGESQGSEWRRHASLTVFVPKCRRLLLRGCLKGVAVEELQAPLILTDAGSQDRDYESQVTIMNVTGPVEIYNVPLDQLDHVRGDVKIIATDEHANTGTVHESGQRTFYTAPPRDCQIVEVEGNLSAWFSRVNLSLIGINGLIDVRNEAGNTKLVVSNELLPLPHRVVSDCGRVEIDANADVLADLSVMAITNNGTVKTNADQKTFDGVDFSTAASADGSSRNWRGVRSNASADRFDFTYFGRPDRVLRGTETAPGLTIISRSDVVELKLKK